MPVKSRIQSLEVSYFVHATEDEQKISYSVSKMLSLGPQSKEEGLEGHYGNRILHVSYHVTGEVAAAAFGVLLGGLTAGSKRELAKSINDIVDEHHTLYLRLNKQSLVEGKFEIGGSETIRLRVKPRLFLLKEGAEEFYRNMFEGLE
jgi:RNA binding exosome subunit